MYVYNIAKIALITLGSNIFTLRQDINITRIETVHRIEVTCQNVFESEYHLSWKFHESNFNSVLLGLEILYNSQNVSVTKL